MTKYILWLSFLVCLAVQGRSSSNPKDSVVLLLGSQGNGCSAVQVQSESSKKLYLMSAAHCSDLADPKGQIVAIAGSSTHVKVLKVDEQSDLMLLSPADNVPPLHIINTVVKVGEAVTLYGFPLLHFASVKANFTGLKHVSVQAFEIHSLAEVSRCFQEHGTLDTSWCMKAAFLAAVNKSMAPGASGGPAVNSAGELVGIISVSAVDPVDSFSGLTLLKDMHEMLKGR